MKLIEIVNRVAINDEIPKRLKFDNRIFEYIGEENASTPLVFLYRDEEDNSTFLIRDYAISLDEEIEEVNDDWYAKNSEYKKKYQKLLDKVNKTMKEMDRLREQYGIKKYNR